MSNGSGIIVTVTTPVRVTKPIHAHPSLRLGVEGGPPAAVAALEDMLLDECKVRDRDRFVIAIGFSQVSGVIAERAGDSASVKVSP
jgi:hypothetical protein